MYYYVFTVAPEIFMMKTAMWCMGWFSCAYIYLLGGLEIKAAYEL